MTAIDHQNVKHLIPDLKPEGNIDLNTKRMNFIYGQGMIVYNDQYAVEIYIPRSKRESVTFFAVQRHFNSLSTIGEYYRRIPVCHYQSDEVTPEIRRQFDEAIFQELLSDENLHQLNPLNPMKKVA